MDHAAILETLELLQSTVDQYVAKDSKDNDKGLRQKIFDLYGQISEEYIKLTGNKSVEVPNYGSTCSNYPNFFEAGFLSGRTFHTYQGRTELATVIGKLKALARTKSSVQLSQVAEANNRVFLVHGHNQAILQMCARFIDKLGLPLTILSEEANKGRTIFQKFLDHSDVGFAVVLLTADDRGGHSDQAYDEQMRRARQNVIFELGFFIGHLKTERVCALYEPGVEIPSDYQGVAFVALDPKQAWKFELAKEMKAAGLPVDMNNVL